MNTLAALLICLFAYLTIRYQEKRYHARLWNAVKEQQIEIQALTREKQALIRENQLLRQGKDPVPASWPAPEPEPYGSPS